jgi:hypothetical protein
MSEPFAFPSVTPAIGLPLLTAGQAQKEFFVNQALSLLDALHPRMVIASQSVPPATAPDGSCFRVTQNPAAAWAGHEDDIAVMVGGGWHFVRPIAGMEIFEQAASYWLVYRGQWQSVAAPASPSGGPVIDIEARATLATLIQALVTLGLLAPTAS